MSGIWRFDAEGGGTNPRGADISRKAVVSGLQPRALKGFTETISNISIAVIDGPYDPTALSQVLTTVPVGLGPGGCGIDPRNGCNHGTFIIGLLGARRDAPIPGLCPDCQLFHIPLFVDESAPVASIGQLARAIRVAVESGARLINLSLAIVGDLSHDHPALAAALDYAESTDAVVMVAAGNQGRLAVGQLLSHPVAIPVVAVDASLRLLPENNFGPAISSRGVGALGQMMGYAPRGRVTTMSGTSVATAVATGILAQVWSARPEATASQVRAAMASLAFRNGAAPPVLDRRDCLEALDAVLAATKASTSRIRRVETNCVSLQGETTMINDDGQPLLQARGQVVRSAQIVTPAQGGCACGAPGGSCTCGGQVASHFVYVLGTVDICFPDQSISDELQVVAITLSQDPSADREQRELREPKADEPLRNWYYRVLKHREARYVARKVCWVLKVEGQVAYYLSLRDLEDLNDLIGCLKNPEPAPTPPPSGDDRRNRRVQTRAARRSSPAQRDRDYEQDQHRPPYDDLDLFVGSSSLVSVEMCPGVSVPVLAVDQLVSFKKHEILSWCQAPPPRGTTASTPAPDPDLLFRMLIQSADNLGDKDEWRALNYLAVRYQPIYEKYAEMAYNHDLTSVKVVTSRLWGEKRIVDPVFAFRHKTTGVVRKFFVRVDVSYLFPMIASQLTEYFDR